MLEAELAQIRASIGKVEKAIDINSTKLSRATEFYKLLSPESLPNIKPAAEVSKDVLRAGQVFNTNAFAYHHLAWEPRMFVLRRIDLVRENLTKDVSPEKKKGIPRFEAAALELPQNLEELKDQEANVLDKIRSRLIVDRAFIKAAIRRGNLSRQELLWIDGLFERYGVQIPKDESIPTPNLEVFYKSRNIPEFFRDFLSSPQFRFLIDCLNLNFEDGLSVDDQDLKASAAGYVFERAATVQARRLLLPKTKRSFIFLPPEESLELFHTADPRKPLTSAFHGLRKSIKGMTVPDGIVVIPRGKEAQIAAVCEFSMSNVSNTEANKAKLAQLELYKGKDSPVHRQLYEWASGVVKGQVDAEQLLNKHPELRGKGFTLLTEDTGYNFFYFIPENQTPPVNMDPDNVLKVHISSTQVGHFTNALIVDSKAEFDKIGSVSAGGFGHLGKLTKNSKD